MDIDINSYDEKPVLNENDTLLGIDSELGGRVFQTKVSDFVANEIGAGKTKAISQDAVSSLLFPYNENLGYSKSKIQIGEGASVINDGVLSTSVAIGRSAVCEQSVFSSVAVGGYSQVLDTDIVSGSNYVFSVGNKDVGTTARKRRIINVSAALNADEAVTLGQLGLNNSWIDLPSTYLSLCKYRIHAGVIFFFFSGDNLPSSANLPTVLFTVPPGYTPTTAMLFSATFINKANATNVMGYSVPVQIATGGAATLPISWGTAMWNASNTLSGSFSYPY